MESCGVDAGPFGGEGSRFDGRPLAFCRGEPLSARLPSYWRLDVRVQKRELFETWYFDFYVDVMNVTFNWEVIGYETRMDGTQEPIEVPLFIPMLGLRGKF